MLLNQEKKSKSYSNHPGSSHSKVKTRNLSDHIAQFPPTIADNDLCHTIVLHACKKMNKSNIEEAGCAVCGELTPVRNISRLKNIKKMIHILTTPGVTCVECKNKGSPLHEYSGPVLDYTCNRVCDHCRRCICKGKVP